MINACTYYPLHRNSYALSCVDMSTQILISSCGSSIDCSFMSLFSRQNSGFGLQNKHSFAGDSAGAYPLVLRISVRETSILNLRISKKVPSSTGNLWFN
jgi:hypothetical protein